jgi:hypothetical protein
MNTTYLTMYFGGTLIDQVSLNYNGLISQEEKAWYEQGAIQALCEKHEMLIDTSQQQPTFLIGKYRIDNRSVA